MTDTQPTPNTPAAQDYQAFQAQLDLQMRQADLMSQSNMIPEKFRGNPANVLVAQEIARSMGETPWVTMSELYFVGNIPTFSAKYMRSRVRQAGHILREHFDPETMTATCVIIRNDDPDYEHTVIWDQQKAQAHGLWGKGHWKKNPGLMLKNRAVSECVREACNEVMGGVNYTPEEAQHIKPVKATATRTDQGDPRGMAAVRAALEAKKQAEAAEPAEDTPTEQPESEGTAQADYLAAIVEATSREDLTAIAQAAKTLSDTEFEPVREALNARWEALDGAQ